MCLYTLFNEFNQNKSNHDWKEHINTNNQMDTKYTNIYKIQIHKTSTQVSGRIAWNDLL